MLFIIVIHSNFNDASRLIVLNRRFDVIKKKNLRWMKYFFLVTIIDIWLGYWRDLSIDIAYSTSG